MIAQGAYENSDQYKMLQDAQEDSLDAIRSNTSALEAATAAYELAQERTKGAGGGVLDAIASLFGDPESDSADPVSYTHLESSRADVRHFGRRDGGRQPHRGQGVCGRHQRRRRLIERREDHGDPGGQAAGAAGLLQDR